MQLDRAYHARTVPSALRAPAGSLEEGGMARQSATQTVPADGATSLAIETYSRLRRDILDAVLAPNARLKARELCVRYAAGLSPVREALNRLLSESLVRHSAQCG